MLSCGHRSSDSVKFALREKEAVVVSVVVKTLDLLYLELQFYSIKLLFTHVGAVCDLFSL